MNLNDKFNAESWGAIEDDKPPKNTGHEINNKNKTQSNMFSAQTWYVEDEKRLIDNDNQSAKRVAAVDDLKVPKKKKKSIAKFFVILIAILLIGLIIISLMDPDSVFGFLSANKNDSFMTISTTAPTIAAVTTTASSAVKNNEKQIYYSGSCGDNAVFSVYYDDESSEPHYVLLIEGSGALWNANDIDWKIKETDSVKEIIVSDGITKIQSNQFSSDIFNSVEWIEFAESVSYIGKFACSLESLKTVIVYSNTCSIDYIENDEYICDTLGVTEMGTTIVCCKGSPTEEYVETWNSNYPNSYILKTLD